MNDTFRLLGLDPKTEGGKYFDDSKWWWHALWNYVYASCEDILTEDEYIQGHHIEIGFTICAEKALKIANRLMDLIESGECDEYEKKHTAALESLPDEISPDSGAYTKPEALMYPFTAENVHDFAEFCYLSGGFTVVNKKEH
ncbi:MAG: hypothetical protein ABH883_02520 [Candidatus Omnitrophota bacterium]